ncbi:MAG: MTH1187 family thiamine-binding protein [Deltaproteobacteria bacterium]|nr:MTH1187 family thiamine-binding protein [Deltaproteobacteria bacterium]
MALMEISIVPIGTGSTSVGDYVAEMIRHLRRLGLPYQLTDMATIVEGDPSRLLQAARELHELPFARGAQRVVTRLVIDDRRDKEVSLGDKTKSVDARFP